MIWLNINDTSNLSLHRPEIWRAEKWIAVSGSLAQVVYFFFFFLMIAANYKIQNGTRLKQDNRKHGYIIIRIQKGYTILQLKHRYMYETTKLWKWRLVSPGRSSTTTGMFQLCRRAVPSQKQSDLFFMAWGGLVGWDFPGRVLIQTWDLSVVVFFAINSTTVFVHAKY